MSSLFFYMGQYATEMVRIVLLLLSLSLFAVTIIRFAYATRMYWKSIALYLALADDLSTGCIIDEYSPLDTPQKRQWYACYCEMNPAGIHG